MALKTPPLQAKGVYQLRAPFTVVPGIIYECVAIRDFVDFVESGQKVFELVYNPAGLLLADYEADKALGANVITLVSSTHPTIHVPDTYIDAYPNLGNVAYNNIAISVAIGPLPDGLDLTFLKDQLQGVASDVIGVLPVVVAHIAPSNGVITEDEHQVLETARQAAINNRTTDRAKLLAEQAVSAALRIQLAGLEQILIDNNLIPP